MGFRIWDTFPQLQSRYKSSCHLVPWRPDLGRVPNCSSSKQHHPCWNPIPGGISGLKITTMSCCQVNCLFCVISSHNTGYPLYCMYLWCECVDKVMTNCYHSMSSIDASVIPTHLGSWSQWLDFAVWNSRSKPFGQGASRQTSVTDVDLSKVQLARHHGHLWPLDSLNLFPRRRWHHILKLPWCLPFTHWGSIWKLVNSNCPQVSWTTWGKNTAHSWTALQRGRRRVYMCHTCRSLQQNL